MKNRLISIQLLRSLILLMFFLLLKSTPLLGQTIAEQNFDNNRSWKYSSNVNFFSHKGSNTLNNVYPAADGWNDDGFYGLLDSTDWDGNISLNAFSDSVLAIQDLDDENDFGTDKTAKVNFEKVNVSGYKSVNINFNYELSGLGNSDEIAYEVYEDGTGQGATALNGSGSETYNVSSSVSNVRLEFQFEQNGSGEYVGIDNIKLEGTSKSQNEPSNQPTNFSADSLSNEQIKLTWTDASAGNQSPDGYLIKAEQSGTISAPSDNIDPSIDQDLSDGSAVVKVGYGIGGSYTFTDLSKNTKYDFQIWSFTNAESSIDFLNSSSGSSGPTASATTSPNENILTESFESTKASGNYSYPNGNGRNGEEDIFDRVKGSDYINTTDKYIYSDYDQSYYIAVEDFDDPLPNANKGIVKIGNIDISNYRNLKIKGAFAAGAATGYDGSDQIEVEASIDGGTWQTIARFTGSTGGGNLQEDTNLDGSGNGTVLKGIFEDFKWDLSNTGDQLSLRVTCNLNTGKEEAAFDNIRVTGKPPKKWDRDAGNNKWSSGDNWDPNGVPGINDMVVLDNTHVSNNYTVNLDQNLTDTIIQSLKIQPGTNDSIQVNRKSGLNTFKIGGTGSVLTIDDGGQFTDSTDEGLPKNFKNNNGSILVKAGGVYEATNNSSQFNTNDLVTAISSASSTEGEIIFESNGQSISVSGQTYPTSLTLKSKTGSAISYTTSGSNPFTVEGDLTIGSNVTYDGTGRSSGGDMIIKGDLIVNGTLKLNSNNQQIKFKGTGKQNLQGASSFNNIEVNNGVDVQLDQTVKIKDTLKLSDGIVKFSNSSDTLIIADDAIVQPAGGKNNAYVAGTVKKIGDEAFTFPLGDGGQSARLGISAPSNSNDEFSASYEKSSYSDTTTGGTLNNVSDVEHWNLARENGNSSVNVTLYWEDGSSSGSNIDNLNDLVVAHWNSTNSEWESYGQDNTTGSTTSGSITVNSVSNFSPFTFGSTSGNDNPLPVELLHFHAETDQDHVDINWVTASETNNSHFIVQKRVGEKWEKIGKIEGNGTTIAEHTYHFEDLEFKPGITHYYRIKQVDFDGSYEYSEVRSVRAEEDQFNSVALYPNPVSDALNLKIRAKASQTMQVRILNLYGKVVYQDEIRVRQGENQQELPLKQLDPAQYFIEIRGSEKVQQKRFIKEQH